MVVNSDQQRAEIGTFNCHRLGLSICKWDNNQMLLKIIFIYFLLMCKVLNTKFCLSKLATRLMFHWKAFFILSLLFICSLLLLHGDIESNPGPRNSKNHLPSFCHWNRNSISAHKFSKMLLLKAYNAICKYGLCVCLELIMIPRYCHITFLQNWRAISCFCAHHPNSVKRGGVCIYYKESLPVRIIN